jgi:hypothetical protein
MIRVVSVLLFAEIRGYYNSVEVLERIEKCSVGKMQWIGLNELKAYVVILALRYIVP